MYLFFSSSSSRLSLSIAWVNICNADNNNNINRKIDAHIQRTHTTNYLNENWNVKIDDGMEQKIYISTEIKNKKLVYSHWVRANTRRTKRHCAFHFAFFSRCDFAHSRCNFQRTLNWLNSVCLQTLTALTFYSAFASPTMMMIGVRGVQLIDDVNE